MATSAGCCCLAPRPCWHGCCVHTAAAAAAAAGAMKAQGNLWRPSLSPLHLPLATQSPPSSHLLQNDALGVRGTGKGLLPLRAQVALLVVLVRPALLLAVQAQLAPSSHTARLACKSIGEMFKTASAVARGLKPSTALHVGHPSPRCRAAACHPGRCIVKPVMRSPQVSIGIEAVTAAAHPSSHPRTHG